MRRKLFLCAGLRLEAVASKRILHFVSIDDLADNREWYAPAL